MVTLEEAYRIAIKKSNIYVLGNCVEYPDFWTFSVRSREDGEYSRTSPRAVDKHNGDLFTFFPPDYSVEFCKSGREVTLEELKQVMDSEDFALTQKYQEMDELMEQS